MRAMTNFISTSDLPEKHEFGERVMVKSGANGNHIFLLYTQEGFVLESFPEIVVNIESLKGCRYCYVETTFFQ